MQTGDKSMMTINPFFPFTLYLTNVSHMDFLEIFCSVRNHVKLEICSFVMNFNTHFGEKIPISRHFYADAAISNVALLHTEHFLLRATFERISFNRIFPDLNKKLMYGTCGATLCIVLL